MVAEPFPIPEEAVENARHRVTVISHHLTQVVDANRLG